MDEFLRDVNVKASVSIIRELLSPSGSEPQDVKSWLLFLLICKDSSGARSSRIPSSENSHKLIRFQRNEIVHLSRAISSWLNKKVTK